MTLPASGGITGQQIRDEIRQTGGNLVFPDATTRWLADKPTGSIILPTDYYNKTAVKRTHNEIVIGVSTVYNVAVNLGIDFAGRRLVVCICAYASSVVSQVTSSGATLAGSGLTQGPGQAFFNAGVNILTGIYYTIPNQIPGTSTTLSVTFNQTVTRFSCVVYSVSNVPTFYHSNANGGQPLTFVGTTVNVNTNGVLIATIMKSSCPAGNLSMSGVLEDVDQEIGGNVRHATGFQNRLPVENIRPINMSGTGSADICAVAVASFS